METAEYLVAFDSAGNPTAHGEFDPSSYSGKEASYGGYYFATKFGDYRKNFWSDSIFKESDADSQSYRHAGGSFEAAFRAKIYPFVEGIAKIERVTKEEYFASRNSLCNLNQYGGIVGGRMA